jgi:hypothetical protein
VSIVDDLWLAALTMDEDDAGSRNRFNLIVNIDGTDVFDQDFTLGWRAPGSGQPGLEDGQAGLEQSQPLTTPFESAALTNSSVRLGIRGENAWAPQHVLLIGRTRPAFEPGRTIALAMETDLTDWLSADTSEGHLTMRLRLVSAGGPATVIRRVLLLVYTDSGSDVETESSIQLQIGAGGAIVVHQTISDDLNKYTAHWYFIDVEAPFTRGDIASNGSIHLSILGTDAWLPKTVFVFGLDAATGRPNEVVTLASIPEWDLGWLSTDLNEGSPSIALPLSI